jgi:hypothetical protein
VSHLFSEIEPILSKNGLHIENATAGNTQYLKITNKKHPLLGSIFVDDGGLIQLELWADLESGDAAGKVAAFAIALLGSDKAIMSAPRPALPPFPDPPPVRRAS